MDDRLRIRIHFVSGRTVDLAFDDFRRGEFEKFTKEDLANKDGGLFGAVTFDIMYVNVSQIEYIEELK